LHLAILFMKNILFFLLLIIYTNLIFGQKQIVQSQEKFFNDFPKEVNNEYQFNLALNKINEINQILDSSNKFDSKLLLLMLQVQKTIIWANKNAKLEDQLKCKVFYLTINTKLFNVKEIIELGNELLNYKDNLTKKETATVLTCLSIGYKRLEAFNEIIKITPLRKKYLIPEIRKINDIENDLALAYYNTKNYKLAATSFLKVKEYFKAENDYLFVSSMSNNTALCYFKLYDYPNAIKYFVLAIEELKLTNGIESNNLPKGYNAFFKSVILSNIAKIDVENGNFEMAISKYKDLKQKTKALNGIEFANITDAYLNISKIYLRMNKPVLAQIYLDSTKLSFQKIVSTDIKIETNNLEAKILLLNGNSEKATLFFNASKKITDSISQIQIGRENILAQAKYNSDEKDAALNDAKIDIKSKEKISGFQKIGLTITSILLGIIAFLYYRKSKDSQTIDAQNEILTINLKEKEMLLKEVHHRVKNNLQVISGLLHLQSEKNDSPQIEIILNDAERQINSIALVHQMLYQNENYTIVSIQEYIKKLTDQLLFSTYGTDYEININVSEITLSTDIVIPIGLIINELFSNSNKHAFENRKGIINISLLKMTENNFEFIYKDNGKGLPKNFDIKNVKTTGFGLLKMLAEEINGNLEIDGSNGFEARIKFRNDVK
jgi:two-component system, sensor histidine kinase PdtaS